MSSFKDYYITPAVISHIKHRVDCIPYYDAYYSDEMGGWCLGGAHLPIFTAPMACVVDDKNYLKFDSEGILAVVPRTVPFGRRLEIMDEMIWVAVGLDEFKELINQYDFFSSEKYICLDVANGHMQQVLDLCKQAKEKFGNNIVLMAGNIANTYTYVEYAKVGIDYCRVGIGDGSGCATNDLTGISQDTPYLLHVLKEMKNRLEDTSERYKSIPKIVIDGGLTSIRDIIIALAMGADYVMCGKMFAHCEEAAGKIIKKDEILGRMYYGMSTERAQREMGNVRIKLSEGKEYWIPIKYTLHDWVEQFVAAISSTMSYCDKTQLIDFIGKVSVKKYNSSLI